MIWKVENKVTHKVDTWYQKDTIDIIKECCKQAEFIPSNVIMRILEDAENECF